MAVVAEPPRSMMSSMDVDSRSTWAQRYQPEESRYFIERREEEDVDGFGHGRSREENMDGFGHGRSSVLLPRQGTSRATQSLGLLGKTSAPLPLARSRQQKQIPILGYNRARQASSLLNPDAGSSASASTSGSVLLSLVTPAPPPAPIPAFLLSTSRSMSTPEAGSTTKPYHNSTHRDYDRPPPLAARLDHQWDPQSQPRPRPEPEIQPGSESRSQSRSPVRTQSNGLKVRPAKLKLAPRPSSAAVSSTLPVGRISPVANVPGLVGSECDNEEEQVPALRRQRRRLKRRTRLGMEGEETEQDVQTTGGSGTRIVEDQKMASTPNSRSSSPCVVYTRDDVDEDGLPTPNTLALNEPGRKARDRAVARGGVTPPSAWAVGEGASGGAKRKEVGGGGKSGKSLLERLGLLDDNVNDVGQGEGHEEDGMLVDSPVLEQDGSGDSGSKSRSISRSRSRSRSRSMSRPTSPVVQQIKAMSTERAVPDAPPRPTSPDNRLTRSVTPVDHLPAPIETSVHDKTPSDQEEHPCQYEDEESEVDAALMTDDVLMGTPSPSTARGERPALSQIETAEDRMRVLREKLLQDKQRREAGPSAEQVGEDASPSTATVTTTTAGSSIIMPGPEIQLDSSAQVVDLARNRGKNKSSGAGDQGKASSSKGVDRKPVMGDLSGSSASRKDKGKGKGKAHKDSGGRDDDEDDGYPKRPGPSDLRGPGPTRRFQPIGESIYVPHSLKHPFRLYPNGTAFDVQQAMAAELTTHTVPDREYFGIASMPACEYTSRMVEFQESPPDQRKLLTLDLNGCLIVRSKHKTPGAFRQTYKRTFLPSFLGYLMAPGNQSRARYDSNGRKIKPGREPNEDDRQGLERMRPYEAFVWSSAQPENVWTMVDRAFEQHGDFVKPNKGLRQAAANRVRNIPLQDRPGRLLGVWDRTSLGLSGKDFHQKSRTSKDLRKILDAFEKPVGGPPIPDPFFAPQIYNTLLLDDSTGQTMKSGSQPWNHVPLPEYKLEHKERDKSLVLRYIQAGNLDLNGVGRRFDDSVQDLQADLQARVTVLEAMFGSDALAFYRDVKKGVRVETRIDVALLAVVGILAELSDVMVVPAWIAAGGLMPDIESSFTEQDASKGWQHLIAKDLSLPTLPQGERHRRFDDARLWKRNVLVNAQDIPQLSPAKHVVPSIPPSYSEYQHWFESPLHVLYWVRRGMVALDERGVPIAHGIDLATLPGGSSPRSSPAPQSARSQDWRSSTGGPRAETQESSGGAVAGANATQDQRRQPDDPEWRRGGGPARSHTRFGRSPGPGPSPVRGAGPASASGSGFGSGPGLGASREWDRDRTRTEQQVRYDGRDRDRRERTPSDLYSPDSRRGPRDRDWDRDQRMGRWEERDRERYWNRDDRNRSRSPARGRTDSRDYGRSLGQRERDDERDGRHDRTSDWSMSVSRSRSRSRTYSPGADRSLSLSLSPTSREYSRLYAPARRRWDERARLGRTGGRQSESSVSSYQRRSRSRTRSTDRWRRRTRSPSLRRYDNRPSGSYISPYDDGQWAGEAPRYRVPTPPRGRW